MKLSAQHTAPLSVLIVCLAGLSLLGLRIFNPSPGNKSEVNTEIRQDSTTDSTMLFGIPVKKYKVVTGEVQAGESFSTLLGQYGIGVKTIGALSELAADIIDLNKIQTGQPYTLFCEKEGSNSARFCVYEASPSWYVKFDLGLDLKVKRVDRKITVTRKFAGGVILSSLSETVEQKGLNPQLAWKLAEIFKWSVDFFALQKGDRFRVIYEELAADSEVVGVREVLAASFRFGKKEFIAIRYDIDEKAGYYDPEGMSLKSRFLQAPLEFVRISSRYNLKRFHPILKRRKPHLGTDYAAPTGTPVVSVADGTVIEAGFRGGNGRYVKIRHDDRYTTQYLHLSGFGKNIRRGSRVMQGQVIGYVGSTGLATGPHLCYRFWKNGKQVDPFSEQPQSAQPIDKAHLQSFLAYKDEVLPVLLSIGYYDGLRKRTMGSILSAADI